MAGSDPINIVQPAKSKQDKLPQEKKAAEQ